MTIKDCILATILLSTLVTSTPVLQTDVPQNTSLPDPPQSSPNNPSPPPPPPPSNNDNEPQKIPLPARTGFRTPTGQLNEPKLLHAINATLLKYNSNIRLPPLKESKFNTSSPNWHWSKRQASGIDVALTDDNDLLYSAPVTIGSGSSAQKFIMDFDTGSSDILVPGPLCTPQNGCTRSTHYSNTGHLLTPTASTTYGGGTAHGSIYSDAVTVANLTVPTQSLLSVTSAPFFATGDSNYDGLFGMAFTGASGSSSVTFVENLLAAGDLPAHEFSFYLGRAFNGTTGQQSELTLGGRDGTKYIGTPLHIPVVNQTAWLVALTSITIDSTSAGPAINGLAGIDTGTSFIVVPQSALAPIFNLIPGAKAIPLPTTTGTGTGGGGGNGLIMYAYPCSTPQNSMPTFHLRGTATSAPFALDPQDFSLGTVDGSFAQSLAESEGVSVQEVEEQGLCLASVLGVRDNVNPDLFVLGAPFLKSWYGVFGYGEVGVGGEGRGRPYVGFAKSVNCGGVGCLD
ncbi:hypothetical protein ACLMJK_005688 [Lecanora helva]